MSKTTVAPRISKCACKIFIPIEFCQLLIYIFISFSHRRCSTCRHPFLPHDWYWADNGLGLDKTVWKVLQEKAQWRGRPRCISGELQTIQKLKKTFLWWPLFTKTRISSTQITQRLCFQKLVYTILFMQWNVFCQHYIAGLNVSIEWEFLT